jgi:uncharacterized cupin superfamily protein
MGTKAIPTIRIENPTPQRLKGLNVKAWPLWEGEASTFDRQYNRREICYLLAGRARIRTPVEAVEIRAGHLVTFPKGLKCTWTIIETMTKIKRRSECV